MAMNKKSVTAMLGGCTLGIKFELIVLVTNRGKFYDKHTARAGTNNFSK